MGDAVHSETEENVLTSPDAVQSYLTKTKYSASKVTRLTEGTTNFTFCIHLSDPYGPNSRKTAILKYAAPYLSDAPSIQFAVERQKYEALALTELPDILSCSEESVAKPKLPELYLYDPVHHVLITEDVAPPQDIDGSRKGISCSLIDLLSPNFIIHSKFNPLKEIGMILGNSLAKLHTTTSNESKPSQRLRALFQGNIAARENDIQSTFHDFLPQLRNNGVSLPHDQQEHLSQFTKTLEDKILHSPETIIMGDFWSGNILLSLTPSSALATLSIIDWEFAGAAPAFVDIGQFLGQLYISHLSCPNDESIKTLIDAFLDSYLSVIAIDRVDVAGVLAYVGAHAGSFGHHTWPDVERCKENSVKAVEVVECARRGEFGWLKDGIFGRLGR